jgi:hypothetical protein
MTNETTAVRPPRLAQWLVSASLAGADGEAVLGDLQEEFAAFIVPSRGTRAARWWYRGQVARSLLPLYGRAWQRASVTRASAACAAAGMATVLPAGLLVALRSFVLQQVPLKTTAEVSVTFVAALLAVEIVSIAMGLSCAVHVLRNQERSVDWSGRQRRTAATAAS